MEISISPSRTYMIHTDGDDGPDWEEVVLPDSIQVNTSETMRMYYKKYVPVGQHIVEILPVEVIPGSSLVEETFAEFDIAPDSPELKKEDASNFFQEELSEMMDRVAQTEIFDMPQEKAKPEPSWLSKLKDDGDDSKN